ncbi:methyl-accepting chemotaxis protein [Paenibacillus nanensis]|uniref:Methyl-accepting chemotaxis protein n=1 Tax=Paenibacillus nanensis TaxID=393251 RepID=A0A3A1V244_9BACL|nr:methyl-accepting chemotaxis protein [Paenibacillus nanensis]RIX53901.1 methyl-accepting chemotaxis protein [Paenibacillus nanensis]
MNKHKGVNWQFSFSIFKKMLLFCIFLLALPSIIVGYSSYQTAKSATDDLIEKNLENSVKLINQNISQFNEMVKNGQLTLEEAQENAKVVMLGAKQPDGTRPINKRIDLGSNGYYYVINKTGDLIAHPNMEGQNIWDKKTSDGFYYIQDVIKQGQNGGGFTFYNWPLPNSSKEALKMTYALEVPEWEWVVVAGSYYKDYNAGQTQILQSTIVTLIICIIVGAAGVILFANHIARPIRQIAADTRKVSAGDLTSEELRVRNKDEIGSLASDFNQMKQYLKALVEQVAVSSNHVSNASTALRASIEETTQASRNIAESTVLIASGTEKQALSTEQSSKAMEEMTQGIGRIADSSSKAFEASIRSEEEARQGYSLIGQSIEKMHAVQQTMKEIVHVMETLTLRSAEISGIVTVMTELSSQTSLLSLNASIEAARAGEEGRGFAVVAQEVKKLAEMSKASSEQINELVKKVQLDIAAASSSTVTSLNEFEQGVNVIEQTGTAFEKIVGAAQHVVVQIEEASATAEELTASSEQIYASLKELDRIAASSAESSELISAATEEQIAVMEQINHSSNALNEMAIELKGAINRFKR